MLGVVRLHTAADFESAEYAVLVRSDLKGVGLGWLLMEMILEYARAEGVREVRGEVLSQNTTMLAMCQHLGFTIEPDPENADIYLVSLTLADKPRS